MSKHQIFILTLINLILFSCKTESIETFELSIQDYNYSLAYSLSYRLNEKELIVIFQGELENEKDSILFSTTELPIKDIKELSRLNLDSLGVFYSNPLIQDGDVKVFRLTKNGVTKQVELHNYYHKDLSPFINLINKMVPKKLEMHHNKQKLIESLERSGASEIRLSCEEN